VLVDADDGYGDAKNVTHTVASYDAMGVSAIFIEDQVSPKRCGHMSGKDVVSADIMVQRLEAALAARRSRISSSSLEPTPWALKGSMRFSHAGSDT